MTNRYRILLILGFLAVSLVAASIVNADIISVPDSSFETPDLSAPPPALPYTSDPSGADALPWVVSGAAIYNVAGYAIPYGEGNVTNPDGAQCGYIGNQLGDRPFMYQTLTETYVDGGTYSLTVGATLYQGGGVGITEGQILSLQLGYWSAAPDGFAGPTIVAERQLALGDLTEGTLQDFTINSGTISGDAAGKNIVVYFSRAAGAPTGRQYSLDNVRLDGTVVPEPGTIVLLVSGLLGLAVFARRKR